MQPAMFYGPGQQPGMMGPNAAGRGGMPFAAQQGMMLPGMQPSRAGAFPGMQGQQGGRGGAQQLPPNAFGLPGQMPFGAMPQAPGGFPGMGYPQALAQVSAQLGRGGQSGRGQMAGMQGFQGMPPQQMVNVQGMRGRDSRPQYSSQPARGGSAGMVTITAHRPLVSSTGQTAAMPAGSPSLAVETILSSPPNQQKQMVGEALYPRVLTFQGEKLAGKITGMLLEMDITELVSL